MTFTVIGRDPRTGRLGVGTSTGEMAIGSRAPYVVANVGAVATQALTDPRLGPLALKLLSLGYPAQKVIDELVSSDPNIEYRQLGVVDRWGHVAARTGANNSAWKGHIIGDGWAVLANAVVDGVGEAMAASMEASIDDDIETRLMKSIDAGTKAGGQPTGQRSAALLVAENEGYTIMNLRVDDHPEPTTELWRLFNKLHPLVPYYRERPDNPSIGRVYDWAAARGIKYP
ncbi:DUF1028 domain-containing protein [Phenylobacterium immobile]|uniref:DUF1028 domain-containing protein n=1 Tax=Phenylobacterium immobile TaxID=21 RepID=UPI000A81667C|nr:DUF1028 domain-containing protein [Phenylobacterium immobile]